MLRSALPVSIQIGSPHCRLGEITYADLNAAANRLAHRILESGGQVGDRVALLMPQDRRIFIAMLAALKAGRIVVVHNKRRHTAASRSVA